MFQIKGKLYYVHSMQTISVSSIHDVQYNTHSFFFRKNVKNDSVEMEYFLYHFYMQFY